MYKLKKDEIIVPFGEDSKIDSSNLTDELAEFCLEKNPALHEKFEDNETLKEWKATNNIKSVVEITIDEPSTEILVEEPKEETKKSTKK